MKSRILATSLWFGIFVLPSPSYADADVDRLHPAAYAKDSVITTKIKTKLAAEKLTSLAKINVDTDSSGAVWLTGSAASAAEADRVVAIASSTEGVSSVKSEITIKPVR